MRPRRLSSELSVLVVFLFRAEDRVVRYPPAFRTRCTSRTIYSLEMNIMKRRNLFSLVFLAQLRSSAWEAFYPRKAQTAVKSWIVVAVLYGLSSVAISQEITGNIRGIVKDPSAA